MSNKQNEVTEGKNSSEDYPHPYSEPPQHTQTYGGHSKPHAEYGQPTIAQIGSGQPTIAQIHVGSGQPTIAQIGSGQPTIAQIGYGQPTTAQIGSGQPTIAQIGSGQPTIAQIGFNDTFYNPQFSQRGYIQQQGHAYPSQLQTNVVTVQPSTQTAPVVTQAHRPPDWMIPAILACLCCCCPFGICAIMAAARAKEAANRGDMDQANERAKGARDLVIISVVFGIVLMALSICFSLTAFNRKESDYNHY